MDQYLDHWNLMSYDYGSSWVAFPLLVSHVPPAGSWDSVSGHQAVVHGPNNTINTERAVSFYTSHGVAPGKLIIGMPLYGRSFMQTAGPGTPFSGVGSGSWEAGVYDYRALPLPGSQVFEDHQRLASWSYDPAKREMISYDTEPIVRGKGKWIRQNGFGGAMFWELSGDKGTDRPEMEKGPGKDPQPGPSLVSAVKEAMGGQLDQSPNCLHFMGSRFDNVRHRME